MLIKSVIILYQLGLVSLPSSYALNNVIIHPQSPPCETHRKPCRTNASSSSFTSASSRPLPLPEYVFNLENVLSMLRPFARK